MEKRPKVGFATKVLSNHHYLNEVSVEGKKCSKFHFIIGRYDLYVPQIIRTGNCITLLSNPIPITRTSFWNPNHFEDMVKYAFWTFNQSFRLVLLEEMDTLNQAVIRRCVQLMEQHVKPYDESLDGTSDEELQWCFVKNGFLQKDPKFEQMYALDQENRATIKEALARKHASFESTEVDGDIKTKEISITEKKIVRFPDTLRPLKTDPSETLDFIIAKVEEANFDFPLFNRIEKLPNGKNPYGLNGAIAAMIDLFYQLNYFKKEYQLEDIFKAYSAFTGNHIAKLKNFISEFRQDNSYLKHFDKLKQLKINKLK